jgi:hypothetical protein
MRSLHATSRLRGMMAVVAVVAIGVASLRNPSLVLIGALLYIRVGLVLYGTFAARYGRGSAAAWWFGFAAFGWASLMLNASHLPYIDPHAFNNWHPYRKPFDIAGTAGRLAWEAFPHGVETNEHEYAAVILFWMTMGTAVAGGILSSWISSHRSFLPPNQRENFSAS